MVFKHCFVYGLIHLIYEAHTVPSSCLSLALHGGSIHECVFTLIEGRGLSASAAGGWYGVQKSTQEYGYGNMIWLCKLEGTEELGYCAC